MSFISNDIPVILACDDRYIRHAAVTLISIIKNSKHHFDFYLLDCGISSENLKFLNQLDLEGNTLRVIKLEPLEAFEKFPLPKFYSPAIFYRLAIPEILKTVDKAIYLDSDIIVTGDLGTLGDIDLGNNLLGAVEEFYPKLYNYKKSILHKKSIGLSSDLCYFNSGVLLLNLKELRTYKLLEKCLAYLNQSTPFAIKYPDQDLLNIIIDRKRFLTLPSCYNFWPPIAINYPKKLISITPICLHFTLYKPWLYPEWATRYLPLKTFRYASYYYFYAKQTPWYSKCNTKIQLYPVLKMLWKLTFQPLERLFKQHLRRKTI